MGSEDSTKEEVGCGGNEDVKMDEWSHQAGQNKERKNLRNCKGGRNIQDSAGKKVKWYRRVMKRHEEYVGKTVMVMDGLRRRGRPKRRWLDSTRNDLSERELSWEEAQDRAK